MSYKIKINEKEYPIKDGFVYKDELNEKLDSALIILDTIDKIDIEPFDNVQILGDINGNEIEPKYLCVDNFMRNTTQYEPNEDYEYTINLMSEVKKLERITLPSLSITKRIYGEKRSVDYYINKYCSFYIPKVYYRHIDPNGKLSKYRDYKYNFKSFPRFDDIECPEFSWNDPTLKEVLDDLMLVDDCIVSMKNNTISEFDLSQKGKKINKSKLKYESITQGSADYVSGLTISMKNSIGKNLVKTCELVSMRSESGEITTENAVILTQHPIYNLKSVKVCLVNIYGLPNNPLEKKDYVYQEIDITDSVVEKDEFDVLSNKDFLFTPNISIEESKKYKQFNLYYKRGDNKIQNAGSTTFFHETLKNIIYVYGMEKIPPSVFPGHYLEKSSFDIRDIAFKVEYETLDDRKMLVGKYLPQKNGDNNVFDAQSSSYVNVQQQSIFEYAKANRLGNEIKTIGGEYKTEAELPKLGDTIDDFILFSREIAYYDNYIEFKGIMTKHYVLKNYFTGIASKRRSWAIAKSNEALTRYEVIKLYAEFSTKHKFEKAQIFNLPTIKMGDLPRHLLSPIDTTFETKPLKAIMVQTESIQKEGEFEYNLFFPEYGYAYFLDSNIDIQGMSICINFGFPDNYSVGYSAFKENGKYRNNIYTYTDQNGQITGMIVDMLYDYEPLYDVNDTLPIIGAGLTEQAYNQYYREIMEVGQYRPLFLKHALDKNIAFKFGFDDVNFLKDNREILKLTFQIEFCSDDKDIIATNKFVNLQELVKLHGTKKLVFYGITWTSFDTKYEIGDTKPKGKKLRAGTKLIFSDIIKNNNSTNFYLKVDYSPTDPTPSILKGWGIADENGDLLLGVNHPPTTKIYLNLITYRDDNVYNSPTDRTIVGKVWNYSPK